MRPGIDLVSVERMRVLLERTPRFLERYFTEAEQAYIGDGARKAERMAAAFAAKEAVAKAMGTGFRGFTLQEIELSHRESGEPYIVLRDQALNCFIPWDTHLSAAAFLIPMKWRQPSSLLKEAGIESDTGSYRFAKTDT